MAAELRWILLLIGVVFIAALALWERRRPRQAARSSASARPAPRDFLSDSAPQPRAPREPTLTLPEIRVHEPLPAQDLPPAADAATEPGAVPVLEVAAEPGIPVERVDEDLLEEIAAADELEAIPPGEPALPERQAPELHAPAPLHAAPGEAAEPELSEYLPRLSPAEAAAPLPSLRVREEVPEPVAADAAAPPVVEWPPDDQRHILALRLVAPPRERFAGRPLRQALAAEGFVLGRFAIFHKPDETRRAVLSAASLNRPGTFDPDTMDSQHFGGLIAVRRAARAEGAAAGVRGAASSPRAVSTSGCTGCCRMSGADRSPRRASPRCVSA